MIKIIFDADSGKFKKLTEAQPEMIEDLDLETLDPAFAKVLSDAVVGNQNLISKAVEVATKPLMDRIVELERPAESALIEAEPATK